MSGCGTERGRKGELVVSGFRGGREEDEGVKTASVLAAGRK